MEIPEEEARKIIAEEIAAVRKANEHRYHLVWQIVGRKPNVDE